MLKPLFIEQKNKGGICVEFTFLSNAFARADQKLYFCLIFYRLMGLIEIEGMEFYAFHGHFIEEQVVGNKFLVNIAIETDCDNAGKSDNLDDALDYQKVYSIIKQQMEKKSFLLENICDRILDALYAEFDTIEKATLKVSKINPPMGGQIEKVSITKSR